MSIEARRSIALFGRDGAVVEYFSILLHLRRNASKRTPYLLRSLSWVRLRVRSLAEPFPR
ncbi:MAG: hypothetical protein FWH37_09755 [Candidatus Bathyarchaeota archaeon]|nr:hypothetical protein [Candidatus Termiticorpusculum sp.]